MSRSSEHFTVRPYKTADEHQWLRCRALAFLETSYYDDVKPHRAVLAEPAIALVVEDADGSIVGILDVEIDGDAATIDTIAVHPDHQRRGIADALLTEALPLLAENNVATIDAWTREDSAANGWYQRNGFAESFRYLHVYLSDGEDDSGFETPTGLSQPVSAFMHGNIAHEQALRARYKRVYICRQYLKPLDALDSKV